MKAKCINNELVECYLTKGEIYDIDLIKDSGLCWVHLMDGDQELFLERFEIIQEEVKIIQFPSDVLSHKEIHEFCKHYGISSAQFIDKDFSTWFYIYLSPIEYQFWQNNDVPTNYLLEE
jgi:hypothetical protein